MKFSTATIVLLFGVAIANVIPAVDNVESVNVRLSLQRHNEPEC